MNFQFVPRPGPNATKFAHFVPFFFCIGLLICISLPRGNAKCATDDGHSSNVSSTPPSELGGCVNFRCPDNYECNSAYKCCLSATLPEKDLGNSNNSTAFGRPFLSPAGEGNLNGTKAVSGLKETIDGFKNFVRVVFSL